MSKLDDILVESVKEVERKTYSGGTDHEKVISSHTLTDAAKAQIKTLMLDLIGDDEELQMPAPGWDNHKAVERSVGRNQEREELRQKVEAL